MRYLKLFEESGEKLYWQVKMDDVYDYDTIPIGYKFDCIHFTENDVIKLKEFNCTFSNDEKNYDDPYARISVYDFKDITHYIIHKSDDEWYYIECQTSSLTYVYFKCDQFDGVLNCLEKECHTIKLSEGFNPFPLGMKKQMNIFWTNQKYLINLQNQRCQNW